MRVAAVVVAAGRGERFGEPKQFLSLEGRSVCEHSVAAARSVADVVVVVVPESYSGTGEGADLVVTGGSTRAESVRAGLAVLDDADIVIVHDAARPVASPDLFARVIDALGEGVDGVIPGLAVSDTLKRVERDVDGVLRVSHTVDRENLVAVQTPQAFRGEVLRRAHEGNPDATDDAALLEALGAHVLVVEGETSNVKITHPRDWDVVRRGHG